MINKMYVIYDSCAEESGPIFEAKNDQVAARNFEIFLKKMDNKSDFRVFIVGEIDHDSNIVNALRIPLELFTTPPDDTNSED